MAILKDEKIKINIVLPAIGHSGGMNVIYNHVRELKLLGNDVYIYKPVKASNLKRYKYNYINKIHQIYCTFKSLYSFLFSRKSVDDHFVLSIKDKYIRNADVIIATSWDSAYLVDKLESAKGKKFYFIQGFEVWDNKEMGLNSYKLSLNKIVVSSWINEQLQKCLKLGPFPIVLSGLDCSCFYNNQKDYKLNGGIIKCLMLNHQLEQKGVIYGIKAFEYVKSKYPNIELRMFGMCKQNELINNYYDYYENPTPNKLRKLYCETDIFIFPSIEEGWGLTPLEAMACKCAIVGTNTGFVLDLGKHGENMMVSEAKDYQSMADNIIELIENAVLRKKISENGYNMIQHYNWNYASKNLIKVIKDYDYYHTYLGDDSW